MKDVVTVVLVEIFMFNLYRSMHLLQTDFFCKYKKKKP